MTKLQTEVQEMFKQAHDEADRSHAETVQRHEEIMALIKKALTPADMQVCNELGRGAQMIYSIDKGDGADGQSKNNSSLHHL